MMEQYKIAAYITAYEDSTAVKNCINAIFNQSIAVDKLLIVDNSIQQPLLHLANQENIIVKFHPENIGIGAGLTLAIKWAIEEEYDFLWAFDQDSVAHEDCLIRLISVYKTLTKSDYLIGILAPAAFDQRSNKSVDGAIFDQYHFLAYKPLSEEKYYECDSPITSGSLIVLNAAKTISYPRADLFIDGVDLDYGLRLKQQGFHNLIVPQAIMYHNFGNPIKINFLQKERYIQKYSALRHYYICRNHTYLETRYAQGYYRLISVLWRIKYMLSTMFWIMFYDLEHKYLKLWACLLGTYHGLKGQLGKTWS
ncbi:glycosyltransferase family 2 protein [Nostoc sp. FACHB-87]|uniref:glycosyltransferase family 2 protein n=1 Tax=Nostocales TaxID=1161 RepID=UPI001685E024|nr:MULTISPECIES: glycosyltransferase family 2 protein [Nostocales]MBD2454938.1 glycosyltransferase family 2 protein [Nostoc sp. FACHB-87]MBD2474741.1 glycosyltransferase family 2 protein [Anabaena sp. FACHB-83]MBD2488086.1 glycosyltransferase family 2 protein [Aulosira sp. FACHB-615]